MVSDIKERLNYRALRTGPGDLCADLLIAAGTIEELEQRNKELTEALQRAAKRALPVSKDNQHITYAAIAKAKGEE